MTDKEYRELKPRHAYGIQPELRPQKTKSKKSSMDILKDVLLGESGYYWHFKNTFGFKPDLLIVSDKNFSQDECRERLETGKKGRPKYQPIKIEGMDVVVHVQPVNVVYLTKREIYEAEEDKESL
jgi:hypothetical protein